MGLWIMKIRETNFTEKAPFLIPCEKWRADLVNIPNLHHQEKCVKPTRKHVSHPFLTLFDIGCV